VADEPLPHVFTEQGVSMLSSVIRSSRAVQVNIEIMRAFKVVFQAASRKRIGFRPAKSSA
jgi:hypothetical protein